MVLREPHARDLPTPAPRVNSYPVFGARDKEAAPLPLRK